MLIMLACDWRVGGWPTRHDLISACAVRAVLGYKGVWAVTLLTPLFGTCEWCWHLSAGTVCCGLPLQLLFLTVSEVLGLTVF